MATTTRPHRPTTSHHPSTTTPSPSSSSTTTFLRRLHDTNNNTPHHHLGFLTLVISTAILLLLTGITLTAIFLGLLVIVPIVVLTSPLWVPLVIFVVLPIVGFLALCGFGVASLAALVWLYRYVRGLHPPGSDRVDYARNRIASTAREVKDYASREYGGYLHSRVKDTAPGA